MPGAHNKALGNNAQGRYFCGSFSQTGASVFSGKSWVFQFYTSPLGLGIPSFWHGG
jgi:hypothetical protein